MFSLAALALHYRLHLDLPKIPFVPAVINVIVNFVNHFMWLSYFIKNNNHPLWEVISFYFFIIWAVPISIAICYSTSELLPGFCKLKIHDKI